MAPYNYLGIFEWRLKLHYLNYSNFEALKSDKVE